jgi:hypothetical protein
MRTGDAMEAAQRPRSGMRQSDHHDRGPPHGPVRYGPGLAHRSRARQPPPGLGIAFLLGGFRYHEQTFNAGALRVYGTMMLMAR